MCVLVDRPLRGRCSSGAQGALPSHRATERSIYLAGSLPDGTLPRPRNAGGVVEWLMAPVLKTGRAQALVGSNPTPSASLIFDFRFSSVDWEIHPASDKIGHAGSNQNRGYHIRQMMRGHVHP